METHRSTSKNPVDSRLREPCHSLIPQIHPQHSPQRHKNRESIICPGQRLINGRIATSDRALRKFLQQLIPRLSTTAPKKNFPHPRKSGRKPHKTSPPGPKHHPKTEVPLPSPKGSDSGTQQTSGELHLVRGRKAETPEGAQKISASLRYLRELKDPWCSACQALRPGACA